MKSSQLLALAALSTTILANPPGPSANALVAGDNTFGRRYEPLGIRPSRPRFSSTQMKLTINDITQGVNPPVTKSDDGDADDTIDGTIRRRHESSATEISTEPKKQPQGKGKDGNVGGHDVEGDPYHKKPPHQGGRRFRFIRSSKMKFDTINSPVERRHESSATEISTEPKKQSQGKVKGKDWKVGGHDVEGDPYHKKPPPQGGRRFRLTRSSKMKFDTIDSPVERRHESSAMEISTEPKKQPQGKVKGKNGNVGGHDVEGDPYHKKPPAQGGGR